MVNLNVDGTKYTKVNKRRCSSFFVSVSAKGKAVDASQEFFALGFSNIMSSFVRSLPLAGSFSRTAVNSASGVKTPLGGLLTGKQVE
jgi:MFS superfamily sulfate permease-like transporter